MSEVVLDASALMALMNEEPGARTVEAVLDEAVISSVNFAEVAGKYSVEGVPDDKIRTRLDSMGLEVITFDEAQAYGAGLLRGPTKHLGLSVGDRACLYLGRQLGLPVMTSEREWRKLDIGVKVIQIR